MSASEQTGDVITLATYAQDPQWVAWRTEPSAGSGKPTKVPKQPDGSNALVNKKTTWATLAAEASANDRYVKG